MHHLHGAAAEYVRRAHHQRVADFFGQHQGFFFVAGNAVRRLAQAEVVQDFLEAFAVFGGINRIGGGADDVHTVFHQSVGQLQRSLAAVMHNHAPRVFFAHDFEHVFQRQRLEVEAVGGVEVGRYGFGVAVDHNGFKTRFAQRQRGVHAAVVKLNTLADTVGAAAENHHFFAVARACFALFFVSGIQIGGVGLEFRRTSIHALIHRVQLQAVAVFAHFFFPYGTSCGRIQA